MQEVYEVDSTRKLTILDIKPEELQNYLKPDEALVIIRKDLKEIYLWRGSKFPVWKHPILDIQELQRDRYHEYRVACISQYEEFRCGHCGYVWYKTKEYSPSESEVERFLDDVGSPEDVEVLLIARDMETTISVRLYFKFRGHQCKEVFYAESALYLLRNSIKPKVVFNAYNFTRYVGI